MHERITYGQLRSVLTSLGFRETRLAKGVCLEHPQSDTEFLFRPYQANDQVTPGELFVVRKMLDERGLLEPESFEAQLTRAPA
jgi:hypothetical protein